MSDQDEWKLATWPDGHQLEKHYIDGQYTGEWREPNEVGSFRAFKPDWIKQLQQTQDTLAILRGSIRGNSPSQKQMSDRLLDAINIVSTQITVERQLIK